MQGRKQTRAFRIHGPRNWHIKLDTGNNYDPCHPEGWVPRNMDNNTRDSEYRAFRVTHADRDSHRRLSSACSCLILHNKQGPEIKIPTFSFLIVFPREHTTGEPSLILQHDICLHALQEPSTGSSVTGWRGWGHRWSRMNEMRTVLPTCSHLPWPHYQILLYF